MPTKKIFALIKAEQLRQQNNFIPAKQLGPYLDKLAARAEFMVHYDSGNCLGFVAFYCNDLESRVAFITLVLTSDQARGRGVARNLLIATLLTMKNRDFHLCRLEVKKANTSAIGLYQKLNFYPFRENDDSLILEFDLSKLSSTLCL